MNLSWDITPIIMLISYILTYSSLYIYEYNMYIYIYIYIYTYVYVYVYIYIYIYYIRLTAGSTSKPVDCSLSGSFACDPRAPSAFSVLWLVLLPYDKAVYEQAGWVILASGGSGLRALLPGGCLFVGQGDCIGGAWATSSCTSSRSSSSSTITPTARRRLRRARAKARALWHQHRTGSRILSAAELRGVFGTLRHHHSRDLDFLDLVVSEMSQQISVVDWRCTACWRTNKANTQKCARCGIKWTHGNDPYYVPQKSTQEWPKSPRKATKQSSWNYAGWDTEQSWSASTWPAEHQGGRGRRRGQTPRGKTPKKGTKQKEATYSAPPPEPPWHPQYTGETTAASTGEEHSAATENLVLLATALKEANTPVPAQVQHIVAENSCRANDQRSQECSRQDGQGKKEIQRCSDSATELAHQLAQVHCGLLGTLDKLRGKVCEGRPGPGGQGEGCAREVAANQGHSRVRKECVGGARHGGHHRDHGRRDGGQARFSRSDPEQHHTHGGELAEHPTKGGSGNGGSRREQAEEAQDRRTSRRLHWRKGFALHWSLLRSPASRLDRGLPRAGTWLSCSSFELEPLHPRGRDLHESLARIH